MKNIITLLLGLMLSHVHAVPPPLTAFGHGNLKINGVAASGVRPLVIILADTAPLDNTPTLDHFAHATDYFFHRTCGLISYPSVNGFLLENSLGDFILSYAGTVDMIDKPGYDAIDFTPEERQNWMVPPEESPQSRDARIYGDTINAASRAGYNFAQHDTNGNNVIEQHELMVLIVMNDSNLDDGAARPANPGGLAGPPFTIQGTTKQFNSTVCAVTHAVGFVTLAHELLHIIGLNDIYGNGATASANYRQSLAGATIVRPTPNTTHSFHLDPWHKLQFGWCEPQIMDMRSGGLAVLQANQGNSPNKHLILYDSARVVPGEPFVREFFMLEYRTRSSGSFSGYDGFTNDNGLVIWHIHHDANGHRTNVPTPYVLGDAAPDVVGKPETQGFQLGMMGGVFTLAPPALAIGGGLDGPPDLGGAWHSGTTTPKLRWTIFPGADPSTYSGYAGTESITHVGVHPFAANVNEITVEVFNDSNTWVEFSWNGPRHGTEANPFKFFTEGHGAVGWGGTLRIKAGTTSETVTNLSKRMTITAVGGPVTIGQP